MKRPLVVVVVIGLVAICAYLLTGFFVIQPIGMLPKGTTIWYLRVGVRLPFISSPDGFLLKEKGKVSLLSRAMAIGQLPETVNPRKIAQFGYSERLYMISTGGVRLEQ